MGRSVSHTLMKKISALIFLITLTSGCVSIQIPEYIQDHHPYKKEFTAAFDKTLAATKQALAGLGWRILKSYQPGVFEQTPVPAGEEQLLLFTESKQSYRFLFSRYSRLNIYLRSLKDTTEVEIRYAVLTPLPMKSLKSYRNDRLVRQLFRQIEVQLQTSK